MENVQTTTPQTTNTGTKCHAKPVKIITCVIGAFLVAFIIFAAGVNVGLRKAKYSYQWGQNYERNFLGGRQGMMGGGARGGIMGGGMMGFARDQFEGRGFRNANGISGTIISIADNNLIIKDKDGKENTVAVTDKTLIHSQRNSFKLSDLKQDDQVVVMGTPGENGVINAALIRVFNIN